MEIRKDWISWLPLIALGMCSFLTFGDLRDKRFQISGVSSRVYSSDKGTSLSC